MLALNFSKQKENSKIISFAKCFFTLQILYGIALAFWVLIENQPKTGDDVEHLHSSWLVLQGKVPYKDFFQHHNPLLWYMFAPLMDIFSYDIIIFDIVRVISTLVMMLNLFIVALIVKRFMSDSWMASLLSVCFVFPSYVTFSGQDFRPDNYMIISFSIGLYYLFSYLEKHKTRDLVISFFMFMISFFFMQKIVFLLLSIGIMVGYLLISKEVLVRDFLKAIILPLIMAVSFVLWLLKHDLVKRYWMSNYTFNLYIPDVYGNLVETTQTEFYVVGAIAFVGAIYYLIHGNSIKRIISILWILEAIQRLFYFSIDRHYYYQLQVLNALLVGPILWKVVKKYNFVMIILIIISAIGCYTIWEYSDTVRVAPGYHRYITPKYVIENTNRCDAVINGAGITYGIFTKDLTYYWNLNGQLDVIGNKIGIAPLPDLNKAIKENLPRIIYTKPYWHEKLRQQKRKVHVHLVSDEIRDTYYAQSIFVGIFLLKEEYQNKRRCRYNSNTKTWEYYKVAD